MKRKWPVILIALFTTLLVIGLLSGEFRTVLEKAGTVCLECIGIG